MLFYTFFICLFTGGHYLELMESRVKRVKESKNEIERSQNWLLRSIYRLMRQIALLQVRVVQVESVVNCMYCWYTGFNLRLES